MGVRMDDRWITINEMDRLIGRLMSGQMDRQSGGWKDGRAGWVGVWALVVQGCNYT